MKPMAMRFGASFAVREGASQNLGPTIRMILPPFHAGKLHSPDGATKPYVTIGEGRCSMVVVPGAADGLRTCVDVAVYLAWFYRKRAGHSRLLILSRREPIPPQFGVERHAFDMADTVDELGWGPAVWECLSAAGPIGQHVAVLRPDLVHGLVLSSTYDHTSDRTRKVLSQWSSLAKQPGGEAAFWETLEQKYRPPAEVLAQVPADRLPAASSREPDRLQRILEELLDLDLRALVLQIACPTLVIGGANDRTVPSNVQQEMAARIPGSQLELYPGFGHFNDMDNPGYEPRVQRFVKELVGASLA
jgi:pimeloyl-ACP methyl ester carboxylesterase